MGLHKDTWPLYAMQLKLYLFSMQPKLYLFSMQANYHSIEDLRGKFECCFGLN
jgi:hypothetical protein